MSMSSPFLLIHITGATVALFSGFMAAFFRKGSAWHAAAGNVFFVSMVCMTTSAAYMAAFLSPNRVNLQVAVFVLYLVTTARVAARRTDEKPGLFDRVAFLVVLADGLAGMTWGFMAARNGGTLDHMPAAAFFMFGAIALLCAFKDARMMARGGAFGARRIARHLWRMCLALLITALSFYPGQAKLFPESMRGSKLLLMPQLMLFAFMVLSLWRITRSYRRKKQEAIREAPTQARRAAA